MSKAECIVEELLADHKIQTADGWTAWDAEQLAIDAINAYINKWC